MRTLRFLFWGSNLQSIQDTVHCHNMVRKYAMLPVLRLPRAPAAARRAAQAHSRRHSLGCGCGATLAGSDQPGVPQTTSCCTLRRRFEEEFDFSIPAQGEKLRLTAAIPVENPYCSCKLTRDSLTQAADFPHSLEFSRNISGVQLELTVPPPPRPSPHFRRTCHTPERTRSRLQGGQREKERADRLLCWTSCRHRWRRTPGWQRVRTGWSAATRRMPTARPSSTSHRWFGPHKPATTSTHEGGR